MQDTLDQAAACHGLVVRGAFAIEASDQVPAHPDGTSPASLVLFGQANHALWAAFSQSEEYRDNQPHPLDRWSYRIGTDLAQQFAGVALFPFGGPPHHPFMRWASKAEPLGHSKLGLLMHPTYGLWHSYRFAISITASLTSLPRQQNCLPDRTTQSDQGPVNLSTICQQCTSQPCLSACPVEAFNGQYYNVNACDKHLSTHEGEGCLAQGCYARNACPAGQGSRYDAAQIQFHMHQFKLTRQSSDQ